MESNTNEVLGGSMEVKALQEAARWYAVRTRPKQEDRAGLNLMTSRVQTFAPRIRGRHLSGHGSRYVSKPLFISYIFAHFDASRQLHQVNYTRGVHDVVSFGGSPIPIEDGVIDLIRERVGEDGFVQLGDELKFGDNVTINAGPFKSLAGIFRGKVNNSDRVRILLDTVQYQSHLLVEREMIESSH